MTQAQQVSAPASMTVAMLGELAKDVDALHAEVLAAQTQYEETRDDLARARRQNAAMRFLLESLVDRKIVCEDGRPATHAWLGPETRQAMLDVLAKEAGADFHPSEQVQPLVDALRALNKANIELVTNDHRCVVAEAIAWAKCIGFK